jgi:hypothetical protein
MMKLTATTVPVRCIGAATLSVLTIGTGSALADPSTSAHDYFAQTAVGTRPDDRAGVRGPNAPLTSGPAVRPDDRPGFRGATEPIWMAAPAPSTAVRPDDRAGVRGIDSTTAAATEAVFVGRSGFDWGDAGIGAGGMLALTLIGGILVVGGRRHAHGTGRSSAASTAQV